MILSKMILQLWTEGVGDSSVPQSHKYVSHLSLAPESVMQISEHIIEFNSLL